jgi:acyl carrier protein
MSIRSLVLTKISTVARQQHKTISEMKDETRLLDSGLDSLCIAIIVAELEDELGLDPLSSGAETEFPATVGDFVRLYENAAN